MHETFYEGHEKIKLNPNASDKKSIVFLYAVYLIGNSEEKELNDVILQKIVKEGLPNVSNGEFIVNDEIENSLKKKMMEDENYSDTLERGAEKVLNWRN